MSLSPRACVLALLAVSCMNTTLARADVHYEEKIELFEVGARDGTPEQIWQGIRRWGPTGGDMHSRSVIVGQAGGKVSWKWSYAQGGGGCRVQRSDVFVAVVIRLPDWRYRAFASNEQKAYWDCIESTVTEHENRHAEIWRETGSEIDRAVSRLSASSCGELNAVINATGNRIHADGQARQRTFDVEDGKRGRYERCEALIAPKTAAERRPPPAAIEATPKSETLAVARADAATRSRSGGLPMWLLGAGVVVLSVLSLAGLIVAFRESSTAVGDDAPRSPPVAPSERPRSGRPKPPGSA